MRTCCICIRQLFRADRFNLLAEGVLATRALARDNRGFGGLGTESLVKTYPKPKPTDPTGARQIVPGKSDQVGRGAGNT
jgi:hypothetical protein